MTKQVSKGQFIIRSLAKIKHKRWEFYVVSRVFHLLDDLEIEFVCQQWILTENGEGKFADMFFPQFNCYLEVNEKGHSSKESQKADTIRQNAILRAIGAIQEKIEIFVIDEHGNVEDDTLENINRQVDQFVSKLKRFKEKQISFGNFEPWNILDKYDPNKFLEKGYLDVSDNPSFRTHKDALRCFGYDKGHLQKATWRKPSWNNSFVWFPRFIKHKDWSNTLSDDEQTIIEKRLTSDSKTQNKKIVAPAGSVRIVFAKTKDKLGLTLYRFVGVFKNDTCFIDSEGLLTWTHQKITDRISIPNPDIFPASEKFKF